MLGNNLNFVVFSFAFVCFPNRFHCNRISEDISMFSRTKRADIDLSTCIDNFDIHKDKIIRTQDSQKMGAKYLNAIDLGSREECLRLCCETENCDVFVYEDKNSGSCYLFHCGPPEDFKCKFTHHVNYSSAVLAINRHLPDLESQIKLTKHEQDLSELRKPIAVNPVHVLGEKIPQLVSTTTTVKSDQVSTDKKNNEAKKCSRYQFECRSTGDCIAIYNACDGVAQCADASDEAPELGCPDASTQPLPNLQGATEKRKTTLTDSLTPYEDKKKNPQKERQNPLIDSLYRPPLRSSEPSDNARSIAAPHRQPPPQPPPPNPDFLRPQPNQVEQGMMMIPQPQFQEQRPDFNPPSGTSWGISQSKDQQNKAAPLPRYQYNNNGNAAAGQSAYPGSDSRGSSRSIFNHKENGLQLPEAEIRYNRFRGAMRYLQQQQQQKQRHKGVEGNYPEYNPKITNYYGENYRQPMESPNWVNAHQEDLRYPTRYNQEPSYNINQNIHNMRIMTENNDNNNNNNKYLPQNIKSQGWTNENKENPEHIQIKMANELEQRSKDEDRSKSDAKTIKIIEKTPASKSDDFPDVVAYKMDGNDGVAQTPGGAVLSLTLGLIITCVMALMIGCRLRIVKRRIRKGGKGYAHDADYLVNGMYL